MSQLRLLGDTLLWLKKVQHCGTLHARYLMSVCLLPSKSQFQFCHPYKGIWWWSHHGSRPKTRSVIYGRRVLSQRTRMRRWRPWLSRRRRASRAKHDHPSEGDQSAELSGFWFLTGADRFSDWVFSDLGTFNVWEPDSVWDWETNRQVCSHVFLAYIEYPYPYRNSRGPRTVQKTCMIVGDMELLVAAVATNYSCLSQLPVSTAWRCDPAISAWLQIQILGFVFSLCLAVVLAVESIYIHIFNIYMCLTLWNVMSKRSGRRWHLFSNFFSQCSLSLACTCSVHFVHATQCL